MIFECIRFYYNIQSEQQRIKAEAKVEELEATIARLKAGNIASPDSVTPTKQSGSIEEFSKVYF